jgi:hypothetical protein
VVLSGNQALDPAGFAPALVTLNQKKVTGPNGKNCAPLRNKPTNLNPHQGGKYMLFALLPGQIDQIPLAIRA